MNNTTKFITITAFLTLFLMLLSGLAVRKLVGPEIIDQEFTTTSLESSPKE